MPRGIVITGLNGCGKTTLGRVLAKALEWRHLDLEDYYFFDSDIPYSKSRPREEAEKLLFEDIKQCDSFVLSAVNGNFREDITSLYDLAVYLSAPADIRAERIRQRSFEKFGERVLEGGDMYEQEQRFFKVAAARSEEEFRRCAESLPCRLIYLDGLKPISENVRIIIENIK